VAAACPPPGAHSPACMRNRQPQLAWRGRAARAASEGATSQAALPAPSRASQTGAGCCAAPHRRHSEAGLLRQQPPALAGARAHRPRCRAAALPADAAIPHTDARHQSRRDVVPAVLSRSGAAGGMQYTLPLTLRLALLLDRAPDPCCVRRLLGLRQGGLGGLRVLEGRVRVGLLRLRALPGVTGALLATPRPPPLARCWPWGLCGLPGTRTPEHARPSHALWRASSARDEAGPRHMHKRQGEAGSACPHCTTVTWEHPDGGAGARRRRRRTPGQPPSARVGAHACPARRGGQRESAAGPALRAALCAPQRTPPRRVGVGFINPARAAAPRTPSRPPLRAAPAWPP